MRAELKIAFIEENFKVKGDHVTLYDYQKKFLKDVSKFRIVNKARQIGFSQIVAWEAFTDCLFNSNYLALFVSTGERAAKELMDKVKNAYNDLPKDIREGLSLTEETKTSMIFKNGSAIYSLPSNPRTIRGYRADHVYLDEFAFMEKIDRIWEAIIPSVSRGGDITGRITIISTPFGDNDRYYDMWISQKGKYDHYSRHKIHHSECPDLEIKEIKNSLTEEQFRQEYCNEFVSEADTFFPFELIKSRVDPKLMQATKRTSTNQFYMGIDFAKERDSTVIMVMEKTDDKSFILRHIKEFLPTKDDDIQRTYYTKIQLPYIRNVIGIFSPTYVAVDQGGVGGKLYEDLFNEYGGKIQPIKFSVPVKLTMIKRLKHAFEDEATDIKIPANNTLITQLHAIKREITISGNEIFKKRKGMHDDYVWALAMVYHISRQVSVVFA